MKYAIALIFFASLSASTMLHAKDGAYRNELGKLCWPTQYSYENGYQIISDYRNKRILFSHGSGEFKLLNVHLNGSHSMRYINGMGYLIDDTEGNRIIELDSLERPSIKYITKIAGFSLIRPHDIIDGRDGYAYIVDEDRIFRISSDSGDGEVFEIDKSKFGYVRSLSLIDGKIHIISASKGKIIRIDDFKKARVTEFSTKSHKVDDVAGSHSRTGPILNSVVKLGGYYYGSNYYTSSYSQHSDPNPFRLIRWKTWKKFQDGEIEDVSGALPKGQVPYFMSIYQDKIMMTSFNHESPCNGDSAFTFIP